MTSKKSLIEIATASSLVRPNPHPIFPFKSILLSKHLYDTILHYLITEVPANCMAKQLSKIYSNRDNSSLDRDYMNPDIYCCISFVEEDPVDWGYREEGVVATFEYVPRDGEAELYPLLLIISTIVLIISSKNLIFFEFNWMWAIVKIKNQSIRSN